MRRMRAGSRAYGCGQGLSMAGCLLDRNSHSNRPFLSCLTESRRHVPLESHVHTQPLHVRWLSSPTATRVRKHSLDREVVVSVLEASATRRDAKSYLQKYALRQESLRGPVDGPHDQGKGQLTSEMTEPVNVAIISLRAPQDLSVSAINGIAKTLSQLRALGLLSVVVVDCGVEEDGATFQDEALRICEAIDEFGKPGARLAQNVLNRHRQQLGLLPSPFWDDIRVEDQGMFRKALQNDMILVVPSLASHDETLAPQPADAHKTILALAKYFTGMQLEDAAVGSAPTSYASRPDRIASVERMIIIDALGGIPVPGRSGVCQSFVNLEQEYDTLLEHLTGSEGSSMVTAGHQKGASASHAANLRLARDALFLLPATSSALITTPFAAANFTFSTTTPTLLAANDSQGTFDGMVTTRKKQNPLLHNLLTDKPAFSSSLPIQRIQAGNGSQVHAGESVDATLVKRGMPLTIYPDPRIAPWVPPTLGSRHRLRLTDGCIDLPRLVNLIEDSFGRKLDVDGYLDRVNENLAGIIIAGEYEGGAILTWERPGGTGDTDLSGDQNFIPYLDKFAVLRSRQGSGGVADIVFNAMVRDCLPQGLCWRSRKDNPVNKWYFERSVGTNKLSNSNWAMFWTTPGLARQDTLLQDYESVCRGILPSWADNVLVLE